MIAMRLRIRLRHVVLGTALAVIAPWVVVWLTTTPQRKPWQCHSDIEIVTHSDTPQPGMVRVWGELDTAFGRDGTGFSRFAGYIADGRSATRIHRAMEFDYQTLADTVRMTTTRSARMLSDNSDEEKVLRHLLPRFRPGNTDYFQIVRVKNNAAMAFVDQPRLFCERQ